MIRIVKIEIHGIKNIKSGILTFDERKTYDRKVFAIERPGVIGIYGENGSGKSTALLSLALFQALAQRKELGPMKSSSFLINKDGNKGNVLIDLLLLENENVYKIQYGFELEEGEDEKLHLVRERLRASILPFGKKRFYVFLPNLEVSLNPDLSVEDAFLSDAKVYSLSALFDRKEGDIQDLQDLLSALGRKAYLSAGSLFFSEGFADLLKSSENEFAKRLLFLLSSLMTYCQTKAFFYSDRYGEGLENKDITFCDKEKGIPMFPFAHLPLKIKTSSLPFWQSLEKKINALLKTCFDDFQIEMTFSKAGEENLLVSVDSLGKDGRIPLLYESQGKKKIAALAYALIQVLNDPGMLLVIDKFDADIFEPFFKKILEVLSYDTKGQLLFTSDSLKALEAMNNHNVYVTTTNPENRFIQLEHVTRSNNLRDFYLRSIEDDGRQKEKLSKKVDIDRLRKSLLSN